MNADLTRWNRAGLSRFRYVDGNAATYLEALRLALAGRFPQWQALQVAVPAAETEAERIARLQAQYQEQRRDLGWELARAFARACHVLTEHLDVYANEGYLGTAGEWDNLRKLVAMLDYHPRPPASAATWLVLEARGAGEVAAGFQVKHVPADGSAPVVFETLTSIQIEAALNTLRPRGYEVNPARLGGNVLPLEGRFEGLATGTPLVLEDEVSGTLQAYVIQGIKSEETSTEVRVAPRLSGGFTRGRTRIHLKPRDRLQPVRPASEGAVLGKTLHLIEAPADLLPGEVVIIRDSGKPRYRRVVAVEGRRLVLEREVGELSLKAAYVSRPGVIPVARQGSRETQGGQQYYSLLVAGDWSRLIDQWVADRRTLNGRKYLPVYRVVHAAYTPVDSADCYENPGHTVLTLVWDPATDEVDDDRLDLSLDNPQHLLVPPATAGQWALDNFLQKSDQGRLPPTLVTTLPRQSAAGDLAVVVLGNQAAWTRLNRVSPDPERGVAELHAQDIWQDRGGGPFFLHQTRVFAHFQVQARLLDWQRNATPLSGQRVPLATLPQTLETGRRVLVECATEARPLLTTVTAIEGGDAEPVLVLADPLPTGCHYGNVQINANLVEAGHGEQQPERVLGSGDVTRASPSFVFPVEDVSFVAEANSASGVRAAIQVWVEGRRWSQVDSLRDSGATDPHYTVRMTEAGYLQIRFGDGRHGRRLPTGTNNLRIRYRQGVGGRGNIPVGGLQTPLQSHPNVQTVRQPLAASGGNAMEDTASLRENAPATLLTLERAVSLTDFERLVASHSSVWQAAAFARVAGPRQRVGVEVVVVPAGGGELGGLAEPLRAFIQNHGAPGIPLTLSGFESVTVTLLVMARVDPQAHPPATLASAVRDALTAAFSLRQRRLGQPLYRGELYQVAEAVPGVESTDCRVSQVTVDPTTRPQPTVVKGADGVIKLIRPGPRQVIHAEAVVVETEVFNP